MRAIPQTKEIDIRNSKGDSSSLRRKGKGQWQGDISKGGARRRGGRGSEVSMLSESFFFF